VLIESQEGSCQRVEGHRHETLFLSLDFPDHAGRFFVCASRSINARPKENRGRQTARWLFPSKVGALFLVFIHEGTHKFPDEAPPLIAKFFKEQAAAVK